MSQIVTAAQLETGDLFRIRTLTGRTTYQVDSARKVHYQDHYIEIAATKVTTHGTTTMSLAPSTPVERLEPTPQRDIVAMLPYLNPGETVSVTYWDGQFWT
ncbi:hypothetical protein Ashraf_93 [Mycobacterium phage Ashraf]|uniref:Uncharacterized protein n=6 Tax=Pegunavirus TaxID=1623295 RepID=A0A159AKF6_9CAUD|nr:hypothetical protein PBI_SDCHARGE11_91 [Mycobacterium phage SDcharge11]AKF12409.1 hypothetical protein PDRPv_97 [Mycobacterium phage PDRPv]AKF12514.1 hypothetical protein PDRPxv_97 [Mycobacterium phage PDRPxv]AQT26007.1 hypothetical protein Ashraf_93 [Mycobacterium phage Ashraf]AQT26111.1 hypothetical protein ImtiyazSitla_93 [Mycobacterium phage ImtiyazSitla]AQT26214.1 hypothetical protein Maskar_93 [Mycobacterium phage Maskar]ATN89331.1 hypothetical protein SEA_HORCHATA_87 [Mycobacterium 